MPRFRTHGVEPQTIKVAIGMPRALTIDNQRRGLVTGYLTYEDIGSGMRRMLNGNLIKGLLIKLQSRLFVNASGASGPFHNRDIPRFGCIPVRLGHEGLGGAWLANMRASEASCPYLTENASKACTIPSLIGGY